MTRPESADPHADAYHLVETPQTAVAKAAHDRMLELALQLARHMDDCTAWGGPCLHGCATRDRLVEEHRQARAEAAAAREGLLS